MWAQVRDQHACLLGALALWVSFREGYREGYAAASKGVTPAPLICRAGFGRRHLLNNDTCECLLLPLLHCSSQLPHAVHSCVHLC